MPIVEIPHSFFKKERAQIYGDWTMALFRELLQNSLDAGAQEVLVEVKVLGDEQAVIIFDDDGSGMTRDVLENVYFKLGETTKARDGNQVGGFGRARILTNFAMDKYEIRTNEFLVMGSGAQYEIFGDQPYRKGCRQVLWSTGPSPARLAHTALGFLGKCRLQNLRVYISGAQVESIDRNPDVAYEYIEDLTLNGMIFGTLKRRTGPGIGSGLHVYVNGVYMSTRYVSGSKDCLIADIDPAFSRSALTASRDQLHPDYDAVFSRIQTKMSTERQYEGPKYTSLDTIYRGRGVFTQRTSLEEKIHMKTRLPENGADLRDLIRKSSGLDVVQKPGSPVNPFSFVKEMENSEFKAGEFLPDIPICLYSPTDEEARNFQMFDPKTWKFTIKSRELIWSRDTKRAVNLYFCWRIAVEAAIKIYAEERKENVHWMAGFSSGRPVYGEMKTVYRDGDTINAVMLNPLDDAKERFHMDNRMDRKFLMAVAKHEVAHIAYDLHNEDFAGLQTKIDSRYDEAAVHSDMVNYRL